MNRWNDELYHHGVQGMKWGVRNAETKARYLRDHREIVTQYHENLDKINKLQQNNGNLDEVDKLKQKNTQLVNDWNNKVSTNVYEQWSPYPTSDTPRDIETEQILEKLLDDQKLKYKKLNELFDESKEVEGRYEKISKIRKELNDNDYKIDNYIYGIGGGRDFTVNPYFYKYEDINYDLIAENEFNRLIKLDKYDKLVKDV